MSLWATYMIMITYLMTFIVFICIRFYLLWYTIFLWYECQFTAVADQMAQTVGVQWIIVDPYQTLSTDLNS